MPVVAVELDKFQLEQFQNLVADTDSVTKRMVACRKQLVRQTTFPSTFRFLAKLQDDREQDREILASYDDMICAWQDKVCFEDHNQRVRKEIEEAYQKRLDEKAKEAAEARAEAKAAKLAQKVADAEKKAAAKMRKKHGA
jgi:hypothetical protein